MCGDVVDITALVTARLPEVTGMLDLLNDGGGHLAHTQSHRHPAGRTHLQIVRVNQCSPLSLVEKCRGFALIALVERIIVLLHQLSYAIKNQLGHRTPPTRGFGTQRTNRSCSSLVLYGIRAPIIGPIRTWKPPIPHCIGGYFACFSLALYGIRELA